MAEMRCDMLADETREKIGMGAVIKKPQSESLFRIVNGGICYTIGKTGNGKSFTMTELNKMCKQIRDCDNADRRWFEQVMPIRARQDPCNLWEQSSSISGTPPWRLDLDSRWHQRALELGCMMSIN